MAPEPQEPQSPTPAERLTEHLTQRPYDLIDARSLMARFRATAEDFGQALRRLEQQVHLEQQAQ